MILDNGVLATLFFSTVSHALVLWVAFFWAAKSQFGDYDRIRLGITLNASLVEAGQLTCTLAEFVGLKPSKSPPSRLRTLFLCHLAVVPFLRYLALAPAFFLGSGLAVYSVNVIDKDLLSGDLSVAVLSNVLLCVGWASQAGYFGLKWISGMARHLHAQHPQYKDAAPVAILTDVFPTVIGYRGGTDD